MKKIKLSQNKFALVDDEDFEWINKLKWYYSSYGYATSKSSNYKTIFMHREILKVSKGMVIDHVNRNKLDNRRENLRICNNSQNNANKSKQKGEFSSLYKGTYWDKFNKLWSCQITINNKIIRIGRFEQERHAAMAYDIWAKELHGKFAVLNFNSAQSENLNASAEI